MRRQMTAIRCDGNGCGTMIEIDEKTQMPEGWISLRLPDSEGRIGTAGSGSFDLCSLRCVEKWARGRRDARGDVVKRSRATSATGYLRRPCPVCDAPVAPQGLVMHVTNVHPDEVPNLAEIRTLHREAEPKEES